MNLKRQEHTPLLDAIKKYVESEPVPFDVPGHKMGSLKTELSDYAGEMLYRLDINAPIGLDNLYHPMVLLKKLKIYLLKLLVQMKLFFR